MTPTKANLRRAQDIFDGVCAHDNILAAQDCERCVALALDAAERRACRGLARFYEAQAKRVLDTGVLAAHRGLTAFLHPGTAVSLLRHAAREARRRGKG